MIMRRVSVRFEFLCRDSAVTISGGRIEKGFRKDKSQDGASGNVSGLDGQHFLAAVVVPDS